MMACTAQIYAEAMQSPSCAAIHLTRVETAFPCDTFMPAIDPVHFRLWSASTPHTDNGVRISFLCYTRSGSPQLLLPKAVASLHQEFQVLCNKLTAPLHNALDPDVVHVLFHPGQFEGSFAGFIFAPYTLMAWVPN